MGTPTIEVTTPTTSVDAPITLATPAPKMLGLRDTLGLWGNLGISLLLPVAAALIILPGSPFGPTFLAIIVGAVIGSVLGLVSIVLAVFAWRGRTSAAVGLCVVRVLSALTAVPAFWVTGVPGPVMAVAGSFIVLTMVGTVLTLAGLRRPALVEA